MRCTRERSMAMLTDCCRAICSATYRGDTFRRVGRLPNAADLGLGRPAERWGFDWLTGASRYSPRTATRSRSPSLDTDPAQAVPRADPLGLVAKLAPARRPALQLPWTVRRGCRGDGPQPLPQA